MRARTRRFACDHSGHTTIEYDLLAALVAIGLLAAFDFMGTSITTNIEQLTQHLVNAMRP